MKLLTKETDYAVRAIMHLAKRRDGFVSSRQIATAEKIPLQFLRRILQTLIREGVIESKEGISGGVRLKSRPKDIQLVDVIKVFQGNIQLADCMFQRRICSNSGKCVLRKRIQEIEELLIGQFENITIASLLKDMEVGDEA
jgi:Rrf2 family protein